MFSSWEYKPMSWTIHGFNGKGFLLNLKREHIFTVVLPMSWSFPEFTVEDVRRYNFSKVTPAIFPLWNKCNIYKVRELLTSKSLILFNCGIMMAIYRDTTGLLQHVDFAQLEKHSFTLPYFKKYEICIILVKILYMFTYIDTTLSVDSSALGMAYHLRSKKWHSSC